MDANINNTGLINIQEIEEDDAEEYINLCNKLAYETKYMLLEPGERQISTESQRKRIRLILASNNMTIFVAKSENQLVGYIYAMGKPYIRKRHSVSIVVGICQAYTSQGIGTRLFSAIEEWAKEHLIHRLELTVMANNYKAIALYRKVGFKVEGLQKHSLLIDGMYIDEWYMSKLL